MKNIVLYILFLFPILVFGQQHNKVEIRGKVLTADGQKAYGINITLVEQGIKTATDRDGHYSFITQKQGEITLKFTSVGIQTQYIIVESEGKRVDVPDFYLSENNSKIRAIIVNGKANQEFNRTSSTFVAKMPLSNIENPQTYTVIPKELIQSQVVTNLDDALKNASGIEKIWSSTGRPNDGAAYFSLRGFATQASMVNGISSVSNAGIDPANIETIEVIKGPSGTLYGGAPINFGGLINIVTKKPIDTIGGKIDYTAGSYNQHRITADVYGPLTPNNKLLGRINAAYAHQGTFQDAGFSKSFFLAPSLQYNATERLQVNFEAELFNREGTNPLMIFLNRSRPLYARNPKELAFDYRRSYTNDDVVTKTPTTNLRTTVNYQLSSAWNSSTSINYNQRKSDGYYQYVMYLEDDNDEIISRFAANQYSVGKVFNAQQNFSGDFYLGNLRNRTVIGFDFLNQTIENHDSPYLVVDKINTAIDDPAYDHFNLGLIAQKINQSNEDETNNKSRNQVLGAYVSNVLDITSRFHILLALRLDHFNNRGTINYNLDQITGDFTQTALSPKAGVVYELLKDKVSIFANYQNGFKNIAPVKQPFDDISGNFKPQRANQFEGGIKANLLQNHLQFTASYYDINVTNTTRGESIVRNDTTYNITVQDGSRFSRGLEFDVTANPIEGLQLIASYSYNESEMVKAAERVNGRRPVEAGPRHLANAWATYTVPKGILRGLGIGAGVNYASENVTTNDALTGIFTLPSYTLINASVFYRYKKYGIAVKGNNLSDATYFRGWTTVEPQMGRNWLGSITYSF